MEKEVEIERKNTILLNKLVDISQSKWSSNHGTSVSKKDLKKRSQAASVGHRSLNISVRKEETKRIERDNHAFAKRMLEKYVGIPTAKFDKEFARTNE